MKKIIIDMDGVLADFGKEKNALVRFLIEEDFFYKLKPIKDNCHIINELAKVNDRVFILSACPTKQSRKAKRLWLKKYIPNLPSNRIMFCPLNADKSDYVKDIKNSILIDDYTKNCKEWKQQGGTAFKYLNGMNGRSGKHKKLNIKSFTSFKEFVKLYKKGALL